jgi:hypothetical protein
MDNTELVERAKMYLKLLSDGVHPITGVEIPNDSVFMDEKVLKCFDFITDILDEYVDLKKKVKKLEAEKDKNTVVIYKKQEFNITREQIDSIKLSKEPVTVLSFMKNINSVIDSDTVEKLSSTRINKWLTDKGFFESKKVQTVVNKTVLTPSKLANKIGITCEETVDKKTGEVKSQIKLEPSAQLFIVENLEEIISST